MPTARTPLHKYIHVHTHPYQHTQYMHIIKYACIHTYTHAYMYTYTHKIIHIQHNIHTYTHTNKHTHTHTHTHTQKCVCIYKQANYSSLLHAGNYNYITHTHVHYMNTTRQSTALLCKPTPYFHYSSLPVFSATTAKQSGDVMLEFHNYLFQCVPTETAGVLTTSCV